MKTLLNQQVANRHCLLRQNGPQMKGIFLKKKVLILLDLIVSLLIKSKFLNNRERQMRITNHYWTLF